MNVKQLIEALSSIPDDVKVNIVIGNEDIDAYSGWKPEVFSHEDGQYYVCIYSSVEDNTAIIGYGQKEGVA